MIGVGICAESLLLLLRCLVLHVDRIKSFWLSGGVRQFGVVLFIPETNGKQLGWCWVESL